MTKVLRHSEALQQQVAPAVEQALKTKVLSQEKLVKGEVNQVYRVVTADGPVILRAFGSPEWPDLADLTWAEEYLTRRGVVHAKILHSSRGHEFFPHGFIVLEYIEGISGSAAILGGQVSLEDFHYQLGQVLARVHSIPVKKFGSVRLGQGEQPDFIQFNLANVQSKLAKLSALHDLPPAWLPSIENKIKGLEVYRNKLQPVLVHSDATPDNCVWDGQSVILIDWDNITANTWLADFSVLTYFGSHLSALGPREERAARIRTSFLAGHGLGEFSEAEIREIESVLHIIKAVNLLPYYYLVQNDKLSFQRTWERLDGLL